MGLHEHETGARITELQDIAALDRLAAEGQPPSVLNRWVRREHREARRGGFRRLLHLAHSTRAPARARRRRSAGT